MTNRAISPNSGDNRINPIEDTIMSIVLFAVICQFALLVRSIDLTLSHQRIYYILTRIIFHGVFLREAIREELLFKN